MSQKLTIRMVSGKSYDFDAKWATYSDRVAFERRFEVNASVIGRFFEDGKKSPEFREEWMAFMAWRALHRHDSSIEDFDTFIEDMEELIFGGEEEAGNPTEEEEHSAQVVQLG